MKDSTTDGVTTPLSSSMWCTTTRRSACSFASRVERIGEDHRIATAVGVEQPNPPRRIRQRRTHQRHDRRDAAAARERHDFVGGVTQTEPSLGRGGVDLDAFGDRVVEPVRHQAAGVALDGDLQVVFDGCRRHRVATTEILAVHGDAQRQELTGLIAVLRRAVLGHVEHQRDGVGRLAHDALDAQRREAVGSVVLGHHRQHIKYLSFISSTSYSTRDRCDRETTHGRCPFRRHGPAGRAASPARPCSTHRKPCRVRQSRR